MNKPEIYPLKKSDMQEKHATLIDQSIKAAFGNVDWQPISSLTRGLSISVLYKIQIDNSDYVARIDIPEHPHNNLEREYHAMKIAAQHQIAPKVYYADSKNGVVLTKFVESSPLNMPNFLQPSYLKKFAQLVHALHECEKFKNDISIFERVNFVYTNITAELKQSLLIRKSIEIKNKLEKLLCDENDIRPSHCDINPYNLLYDGNKFWLVDWNAASQQNFYFDLATCATFFYFYSEHACNEFLKAYFSRELTDAEKNKFSLMKIFVAIYFGMMFIYQSRLQNFPLLSDKEMEMLPSYPEFMKLIGQGKAKLDNPYTQQKFGFVFLKSAFEDSQKLQDQL